MSIQAGPMNSLLQVDADALDAARTMLRGFKRKFQETGIPPIFIHTVRSFY